MGSVVYGIQSCVLYLKGLWGSEIRWKLHTQFSVSGKENPSLSLDSQRGPQPARGLGSDLHLLSLWVGGGAETRRGLSLRTRLPGILREVVSPNSCELGLESDLLPLLGCAALGSSLNFSGLRAPKEDRERDDNPSHLLRLSSVDMYSRGVGSAS